MSLIDDGEEIQKRWKEKKEQLPQGKFLETPLAILFLLYDLRIASAHRGKKMWDCLLGRLGSDRASIAHGTERLLDAFYDSIIESLSKTNELLRKTREELK